MIYLIGLCTQSIVYVKSLEIISILFWLFTLYISINACDSWINPFSLFFATFSLFIFSRVVLTSIFQYGDYTKGDWFFYGHFTIGTRIKLIWLLILFMLAYGLGIQSKAKRIDSKEFKLAPNLDIQKIGLLFFSISFPFFVFRQLTSFLVIFNYGYIGSHMQAINYSNPIINILASFFYMGFFLYMSGVPSKRNSLIIFIVFVLCSGLSLFQGSRGEFFSLLLAALWVFLYVSNYKFGFLKALLIGFLLIFIADFTGYIRNGVLPDHLFGFTTIFDFLYSQGVSILVPGTTIQFADHFSMVDGFHSLFSQFQLIFQNLIGHHGSYTIETATKSWDLSHKLAYFLNKNLYLSGSGLGTSFLAEMYLTGGLLGVFIITFLFSISFRWFYFIALKSNLLFFVFAFTLTAILFIPRGSMFYFFVPLYKSLVAMLLILLFYNIKKKIVE